MLQTYMQQIKYTYMLGATREAQGAYRAGHPTVICILQLQD